MTREVTLILDNVRLESMNPYWTGKVKWRDRADFANFARLLVRDQIDPQTVEMFTKPVKITFTVFHEYQPLDPSNIVVKPFEDGLIGWLIEDDSWLHVDEVSKRSRLDKESPRLEIHIKEIDS